MNLNDLFVSTQGEGQFAGQVTTFVRFGGCNLACAWCDESASIPIKRPASEATTWDVLLERILALKTHHVCFTGGEPLIQKRSDLVHICRSLKLAGKTLSIESNSTRVMPELGPYIDLWTLSPKLSSADVTPPAHVMIKTIAQIGEFAKAMQLKFVIGAREDVYDIKQYFSAYPAILTYIQSMWIEDRDIFEPKYTIAEVQQLFRDADIDFANQNIRFGVQLHKFFNMK